VDLVKASVSFSLSGFVENLTLTGTAALSGTGNGLANKLTGNAGANALRGEGGKDALVGGGGDDVLHGGAGSDVLTGGGGGDRFVFDTAPHSSANMDKITDFVRADGDKIVLEDAVYTALLASGTGNPALLASQFVVGTAATTAEHRIIYNQSQGRLFYDADGNGAGAAVQFATVAAGMALSAADLWVV
jgi:Ca2+-binding RTX toxin-like protein